MSPFTQPRPSHVSTSEWQSFEIRMRRRRAERCLLRAEEALAAGFESESREALEEARRLTPGDVPEFEDLRALVRDRLAAESLAAERQHTRRRGLLALAGMVVAAAVLLGFGLLGPQEQVATTTPAVAPPPLSTAAEPQPSPPPDVLIDQRVIDAVALRPPAEERSAPPAAVPVRASLTKSTALREPVGTAGPDPLPDVAGGAPAVMTTPPVLTTDTARSEPARPAPPPIEPVTASLPEPPPPPAKPAPAVTAPEPAETRIREVLSVYERAFGALDASAVRTVWPTVDGPALARAFDGLASQAVSLGRCAINVEGDAATARCSGSAEWTPRVGGGSKSSARRWDFSLRNSGEEWRIVGAVVR